MFKDLSALQLNTLQRISTEVTAEPGDVLTHEDMREDNMFVILDGEVEVLKAGQKSEELLQLRTLGTGDTFGELNLTRHRPASASIRATRPSHLLAIPIASLRELMEREAGFYVIHKALALKLDQRLRHTSDVTVKSLESELENAHLRIAMGSFLLSLIIMLSFYTYMLKLLSFVSDRAGNTIAASLPLIVLLLVVAVINIRIYKFPLSFYGVTLKNWRRAVVEGFVFTLPILAVSLLAKWLLFTSLDAYRNVDLFTVYRLWISAGWREILLTFLDGLYYVGISVAAQEFFARGIQSCLQRFLVGRDSVWMAIFASNLLFSVFHLFVSLPFSVATFFFGLFWGWLYARHGTLIGPIISHAPLGFWALYILGIMDML